MCFNAAWIAAARRDDRQFEAKMLDKGFESPVFFRSAFEHKTWPRYETIHKKPSFRHLVDENRCGVLMDGFVEWR